MGKYKKEHLYKVGQYVNVTLKIVEQIRVKHGKKTTKGYIVQSVIYPNTEPYETTEGNLKRGSGCSYKAGRRVFEGNSLWSNKGIRSNIINIIEAKGVAGNSSKKLLFKCASDDCSNTKIMTVFKLVSQGFSCKRCNSNISYPEKFFLVVDEYFKLNFKYQQNFKNGRFDFINHTTKTVVEMNGLQHYEDNGMMSYKDTKSSDDKKRKWCKENGYTLIFIDARKSDFNFIKDNINACEHLPNILLEDEKEIKELIKIRSKYDVTEIIKLYEVDKLSTIKIGEKINVNYGTINGILRRHDIKLRNHKRTVRCIETGVVYESGLEASRHTELKSSSGITDCCNGKAKTAGGYHWEFVTEENESVA